MTNLTYLTTMQLAERIHYHPRYIREKMVDKHLLEGIHYLRPFGGRKILFIWETIEEDMVNTREEAEVQIPLASGGVCYG